MKIPSDLTERDNFYQTVIQKCTVSQENRANDYAALRQYYLFGGSTSPNSSPFNRVFPHIDLLTSFLYAAETTKFTIQLGATVKEHEYGRVPVLAKAINDRWNDSHADGVVSTAITWALVDNTRIVKLIPRVNKQSKKLEIAPFVVHAANFGVYREDVTFFDRQEAMTHSYYTTKTQLEIDLADHPHRAAILASVDASSHRALEEESQDGVGRLMASTQQPLVDGTTAQGNVEFQFNMNLSYLPDLDQQDLITMDELWIWDTDAGDYRIVTRVKDGMTIYDRIASKYDIFLPGEHPFIQFCPSPTARLLLGHERSGRLGPATGMVQRARDADTQVAQPASLPADQTHPVSARSADEKMYALFEEGGLFTDGGHGVQAGKLQRFPPQLPEDMFRILKDIDAAFADFSGLPNTVQGKGEVGVRSGKQTDQLARLGSARIKKRALVIENYLERMATLYLKLMKKYDGTTYLDDKGTPFTADQFTDDFTVKVDAHSNSPIFVEDKKELAFSMLEQHMITRERAVEMIDPVDKEIIKRELKSIEAQEQQAAQAERELQMKQDGMSIEK